MDTLVGRVALLTGASRGIGAAIAHTLHEAGVRLSLADVVAQPANVTCCGSRACVARASADAVPFVVSRPRTHRILEVAFRSVTEISWG